LGRRPVERQDCPGHLRTLRSGDLGGDVKRYAERVHLFGAVLNGSAHHGVHQLLAVARGLPDLREVVPNVIRVEQPEDVAGPAAHQLGSMHHHVHDVATAPVVSDKVDRSVDALEFALEPVAVGEVGRGEVVGQWTAESRWGQSHHVVASECIHQWAPQSCSLRIAVHENQGHGLNPVTANPPGGELIAAA
jgi:hypothetical protein